MICRMISAALFMTLLTACGFNGSQSSDLQGRPTVDGPVGEGEPIVVEPAVLHRIVIDKLGSKKLVSLLIEAKLLSAREGATARDLLSDVQIFKELKVMLKGLVIEDAGVTFASKSTTVTETVYFVTSREVLGDGTTAATAPCTTTIERVSIGGVAGMIYGKPSITQVCAQAQTPGGGLGGPAPSSDSNTTSNSGR